MNDDGLLREALGEWLHAEGLPARVIDAVASVAREPFLPPGFDADEVYGDDALPIGCDQRATPPRLAAHMVALADVRPGDRALVLGAGRGYTVALLEALGATALGVELEPSLVDAARAARMTPLNIVVGDAARPPEGPWDVVLAHVAVPTLPTAWTRILAPGGRLVAPVGQPGETTLHVWREGILTPTTRVDVSPLQPPR